MPHNMHQQTGSALVQVTACRLFKCFAPSHYLNQCLIIVNWTLRNKFSEIRIKIQNFSFMKMHLKMLSAKLQPYFPGRDELRKWSFPELEFPHWGVSLTHWGRDKMAISQTTLSNAFSLMKILVFLFKFHWSLFLSVQSTIFHHWFR